VSGACSLLPTVGSFKMAALLRLLLTSLALWGSVALWGCKPAPPPEGIVVLLEAAPDSLDDRMTLSAVGQRVAQLITPGLVTFDDLSEPVPDLAESFEALDDRTLRFTLRDGLTFHDGSTLDSADVKATYEALLTRAIPSPRADRLEPVERIETPDARTVIFHLKRPYAPLLAELTIGVVPRARAREVELQGAHPIGAGPFRFSGRKGDEWLELLPFEGYHGGPPDIRKVHLRVVRDETTRVLELLKGRADLVVNAVSPAVLPVLREKPDLEVLTRPGTGYAYMGMNLRRGPLADERVRRAVCHLVRPEAIVTHKFHGLAVPASGMIPRDHWAYAPTPGCRHDPELAGRLLDEAGYPDPDGPGGKPRLTLSYKTSTDRFRKAIALVLKEQLEQGGVGVDLRTLEFGTFFQDVRRGNFELITLKWAAVVEPDLLRWVYGSSFIPTAENNFGGLNRGAYRNEALDGLLERASAAPHAERVTLYAEAQRILDRDLPYVPLWHESSVAVVSRRLAGYEPSAHGFFRPLAHAREVR
jgi:peptide/nickel transport system substrate-binding protein